MDNGLTKIFDFCSVCIIFAWITLVGVGMRVKINIIKNALAYIFLLNPRI